MDIRYVRVEADANKPEGVTRKVWQVVHQPDGAWAMTDGSATDEDLFDVVEVLDELLRVEIDAERGHP